MSELDVARERWLKERPDHERFGKELENDLAAAVQRAGIWRLTDSRAKEPHSLVKKLLKGKHTYDLLPDRVGVRCILRYRSDLDAVVRIAEGLFECSDIDRKADRLGIGTLGYTSIHARVCFCVGDPRFALFPPSIYWAELQVRTLAQHLWAEMAHDSVYKNEETVTVLPPDFRRRVNLMAGLIEVADREFARLNEEIPLDSSAQLYKALERYYYRLATKVPDSELSLEIIRLLEPLYKSATQEIVERLDAFFSEREQTLRAAYADAAEWDASPLLYQPEALMIYERLENDQLATRRAWNDRFPEAELERVANTFGISFD